VVLAAALLELAAEVGGSALAAELLAEAEEGVLVTAGAGAELAAGVLEAGAPGVGDPGVAMGGGVAGRMRDWGGQRRLQLRCRRTSAVGLPEIDDSTDREIGEHGGVRAGQARCRSTGGEHPVAR
jgi:hypothetical protein